MIDVLPVSHDNVLALRATEKLTADDYRDVIIPQVRGLSEEHGRIRVVMHLDEGFRGWAAGALWEDTKFGIKHTSYVERLAVIGGPDWIRWAANKVNLLTKCEVKTYPVDAFEEALAWIES